MKQQLGAGELDPASPRAAGPSAQRTRPPIPSARGPHPNLRPQGDLDPSRSAISKSQTRSQPEASGEAAARSSERRARRARPAASEGGSRAPASGRRGTMAGGAADAAAGAEEPGRWGAGSPAPRPAP